MDTEDFDYDEEDFYPDAEPKAITSNYNDKITTLVVTVITALKMVHCMPLAYTNVTLAPGHKYVANITTALLSYATEEEKSATALLPEANKSSMIENALARLTDYEPTILGCNVKTRLENVTIEKLRIDEGIVAKLYSLQGDGRAVNAYMTKIALGGIIADPKTIEAQLQNIGSINTDQRLQQQDVASVESAVVGYFEQQGIFGLASGATESAASTELPNLNALASSIVATAKADAALYSGGLIGAYKLCTQNKQNAESECTQLKQVMTMSKKLATEIFESKTAIDDQITDCTAKAQSQSFNLTDDCALLFNASGIIHAVVSGLVEHDTTGEL